MFLSKQEVHKPGAKFVGNNHEMCGLDVAIISIVIFAVFCLKVEKKMKKEEKIEMRKNDSTDQF